MDKARKKFVLYAEIAVFVLLTVLLSVINIVNFTMVSEDADRITEILANSHGSFDRDKGEFNDHALEEPFAKKRLGGFGNMGPGSPETDSSVRYFTFSIDENGNAQKVAFKMSAYTESEAAEWAKSLQDGITGWTRVNYRYRVYRDNKLTFVTVIDQGRELLPSYRILIISLCGGAVLLVLSMLILMSVGKKLFKPLEESDRKQKQFITNVEKEFKHPLTIINANTELIEKQNGPSECTNIINKQVKKMTALVKDLGSLGIFHDENSISKINLSDIFVRVLDSKKDDFNKAGIELRTSIKPDVTFAGDENSIKRSVSELAANSLKYSVSYASFTLEKNSDRIIIRIENDTTLPDGNIDQIFDRFTTLENAVGKDCIGLGLSYVKQTVNAYNGRASAKVNNGVFNLKIDL